MVIGILAHLLNKVVSNSASRSFSRGLFLAAPKYRAKFSASKKEFEIPSLVLKPKKNTAARKLLLQYVNENLTFEQQKVIPKHLVRVQTVIPYVGYIINKPVADSIKDILKAQDLDLNGTVIELSPGLGFVTSELVNLGFQYINCFEDSISFSNFLKSEKLNITIIDRRFLRLAELHNVDKHDGEYRVGTFLKQLNRSPKSKNLYIIGIAPRVSLFHFLIRSLVTQTVFHDPRSAWESPTCYFLLGPRAHWVLTAKPDLGFYAYRSSSVLFQLFFNYEVLGKFPREIYIPWEAPLSSLSKDYSRRGKGDLEVDDKNCYFVKITVNKEIVERIGVHRLVHFWYFVKNNLYARRFTVIPKLESWVPDCGPQLIRKGFTIFTKFGDLTPEQILDLYEQFVSLPGFEHSSFIEAVEKYVAKAEIPDEDVLPIMETNPISMRDTH